MLDQPIRNRVFDAIRNLDDWFYEGNELIRILFVMTDSYGFSCQAPIIEELQQHPNIYLRTTTDKERPINQLSFTSQSEEDLFSSFYVNSSKASYLKWHLIVDSHPNSFYPKRRALRVGMHHGSGFGILGSKIHYVKNFDIFLGLSQAERYFLEEIESNVFENNRAFFAAGSQKGDTILNSKSSRGEINSQFNLEDRPNILITSHWQTTSTLSTFSDQPFEILSRKFPGFNVIQTGHPWLWKDGKEIEGICRETLINQLQNVEKQYPNAYFLPFANAEKLLWISDLLVADHSSIMTSYCLLDRPIVWFDNPAVNFAIPAIREIYKRASNTFTRIDDLADVSLRALNNPHGCEIGRQQMRETFSANIGNASKTAAEILMKIGPICSRHSPRWNKVMALSKSSEHLPNNPNT